MTGAVRTCLDADGMKIAGQIYKAMEMLGADPGLLSCIGSWGDTMDDVDILHSITQWVEMGEPFMPEKRGE